PPADWTLVPPGDPGLTRRLKAAGPTWTVQEKRGRKPFSRGVWTARATVERIKSDLAAERADPKYARRREVAQAEYVQEFEAPRPAGRLPRRPRRRPRRLPAPPRAGPRRRRRRACRPIVTRAAHAPAPTASSSFFAASSVSASGATTCRNCSIAASRLHTTRSV